MESFNELWSVARLDHLDPQRVKAQSPLPHPGVG